MSEVETRLKPALGGALNRTAARAPREGTPGAPPPPGPAGGGRDSGGGAPGPARTPSPGRARRPAARGAGLHGGRRPVFSGNRPAAGARLAVRDRRAGRLLGPQPAALGKGGLSARPFAATLSGTLFSRARVSPAPSCTTNHLNISAQNPIHCGPHIKKCYSL